MDLNRRNWLALAFIAGAINGIAIALLAMAGGTTSTQAILAGMMTFPGVSGLVINVGSFLSEGPRTTADRQWEKSIVKLESERLGKLCDGTTGEVLPGRCIADE